MFDSGEKERETIRSEFNPAIMIDFQGAKFTSDSDFLLLRVIAERSASWAQSGMNWRMPALYQCAVQFVTSEDPALGFSWEVSSATNGTA